MEDIEFFAAVLSLGHSNFFLFLVSVDGLVLRSCNQEQTQNEIDKYKSLTSNLLFWDQHLSFLKVMCSSFFFFFCFIKLVVVVV